MDRRTALARLFPSKIPANSGPVSAPEDERGHHDATWRPGAMDADWDEVSRYLRTLHTAQPCLQPHVRARGEDTESARRGRPRHHLALRIVNCRMRLVDCRFAQRRAKRPGILTRMPTVESSTPPSTGRAVAAYRRHRARLRFKPGAPVGWKRICTLDPTDASGPHSRSQRNS